MARKRKSRLGIRWHRSDTPGRYTALSGHLVCKRDNPADRRSTWSVEGPMLGRVVIGARTKRDAIREAEFWMGDYNALLRQRRKEARA